MFWKVMKNDKVVDLLQQLQYIQYQYKHDVVLLCEPEVAEAVLSSDGKRGFHIEGLYNFKPDNAIYCIEEISESTYNKFKKQLEMEG
jgi:hypothetical protein